VVQEGLKVRCGLPENQVALVRTGDGAEVRVPEAGLRAAGRIRWVGAVLDGRSRTLPLELSLQGSSSLRPGMACQVELRPGGGSSSLVVPVSVVQTAPDHAFLFVEEQGRAVRRVVVLGERDGDQVAVEDGLREGDRLVVSGHRRLVDGQALKVVGGSAGKAGTAAQG